MFIAALFTIAKTWIPPKCPSMIDWTGKMWHMYTMEYYAAIKNDEFGQVWWLMPVIQALWRPRRVDHLRLGVQDQPDQHGETPSLKIYIVDLMKTAVPSELSTKYSYI